MICKVGALLVLLVLAVSVPAWGLEMQGEWEAGFVLSNPEAGASLLWQTGVRLGGDVPLAEQFTLSLRMSMIANSQASEFTGSLERCYLQYESGPLRLRLGRQAVSWGAGWFFRPTDLIAPRSPLDAEAARPGRGMVSAVWATSPLTAVELAAGEDLYAARAGWRIGRTSLRVLGLSDGGVRTVGLDLQGGLAGVYGEACYEWTNDTGDGRPAAMIGWKKIIANNRLFYLEYLHDERGWFHLDRNYLAVGLEIPRDELTTYTFAGVSNLDDGGTMLTGLVSLLLTDNLDLRGGVGLILGPEGTEFLTLAGGGRTSLNLQAKYYF